MTKNQIEYMSLVEEGRHNRATEQETIRSNKKKEALEAASQAITAQHNLVSDTATKQHYERQDYINDAHYKRLDAETKRANQAKERLTREAQNEVYRHDKASEAIDTASNLISQRHFTKSDSNTAESNRIANLRQAEDARHQQKMDQISMGYALAEIESTYLKEDLTLAQSANYRASTNLIDAQTRTEGAKYYDTLHHIGLLDSQRDLNAAQYATEYSKMAANYAGAFQSIMGSIWGRGGISPNLQNGANSGRLLDDVERSWRYGQY